MKKIKIFDVFIWMITFVFVIGVFFLPKTVPVHWDVNWNIDRYGSRYELFIVAFIPLLTYYGMLFTKKIDPHRKGILSREKTYDLIRTWLSLLMILFAGFIYVMTIKPHMNGTFILCFLFGFMFIGLGNYMPKIPKNYFLGIRTPWTMASEYVWKKTHLLSGYAFVISGVLIILSGFISKEALFIVLLGVIFIDMFIAYVYSYKVYQKETKNID